MSSTRWADYPLAQLTLVRFREFWREPEAIFWVFVFPILLAAGLGLAFRNRPPEVIGIAAVTPELAKSLRQEKLLDVEQLSAPAAEEALRTGKVALLVAPSPGGAVVYRYDNTNPEGRTARMLADRAIQRAAGRADPVPSSDRLMREPGSRYIDFLIPGLLGFNLMSSGLWGVGFVLVEMRVRKLIKRMTATPMSRTHFLLSFVLVRGLFLLGELPLLLAFAHWVFEVPIRGSLLLIVALSTLGSLVFAGMGLLVGSRAQNTQTVAGLVNLVSLPMAICSGVFFSAARFPEVVQPLIKVLPLTALIEGVRAVMLDGAGPAAVAQQVTIMLVWGAVSFGVALRLFRWQ